MIRIDPPTADRRGMLESGQRVRGLRRLRSDRNLGDLLVENQQAVHENATVVVFRCKCAARATHRTAQRPVGEDRIQRIGQRSRIALGYQGPGFTRA